jgi:DNA-binding beta-propeller fold protein YncE
MALGTGDYQYEVQDLWGKRPMFWTYVDAVGVAVDSNDNVYAFNRSDHPVMVFDREGNFLHAWGTRMFTNPHGITIGPDDSVYCVDDKGHVIRKFDVNGRLLMTIGTYTVHSDTGYDGQDSETVTRAAPPFNRLSNVAVGPTGNLFVSDGYGNARIHRFTADGKLLYSWGEPGNGPGQFLIPHGLVVDSKGQVYVADRENNRVQVFTSEGESITIWDNLRRPCDMCIDPDGTLYLAEAGHQVSIWTLDGKLLSKWGTDKPSLDTGYFVFPHSIAIDSHGDLYVADISESSWQIDRGSRAFQKFIRVR